jgi:hypothetical protein
MPIKQWEVPGAPELTIKESNEGANWFNDPDEIALPEGKGHEANIPVISANLYVQKKKSARFQYTLATNKMMNNLITAMANPGSQGSQQLLIQGMEALSIRRGLLEKLEAKAWAISMLITPASLENDQKAVSKRNKKDELLQKNYLSVIT